MLADVAANRPPGRQAPGRAAARQPSLTGHKSSRVRRPGNSQRTTARYTVITAEISPRAVAATHRRGRTFDHELLTDGEFDAFRALRPQMHKIAVVEDSTVHFAVTGIVQILDNALDLLLHCWNHAKSVPRSAVSLQPTSRRAQEQGQTLTLWSWIAVDDQNPV